jgi:hypothetical protein
VERGNAKHGPVRDEQLAHEAEGMVRGAPQRAHGEEWRESEPLDEANPAAVRPEATAPRPSGRDFDLRTELARILTRDAFPADRDTLTVLLTDSDAPQDLIDRVARLPGGRRFGSTHEVLDALGISSPETRRDR